MKTVETFSDPYVAHIAQGALQSEGILAEIMNENSVYTGLGVMDQFQIKLVVNDEDYEAARKILAASLSNK